MGVLRLTKEEEYAYWTEIYRNCVDSRRDIEQQWVKYYNAVDDQLFVGRKNADKSDVIEINELSSIVETIIPNIILKPGSVEVRAVNEEDIYRAVIYEYIAKYILRHYNIRDQFIRTVFDTLVLGDGLVKVGYWLLPLIQDAQWRAGMSSSSRSGGFVDVGESAFALHTKLFEFYPDYHIDDWSQQRFFIHEVWKHISEFEDNDLYDKKVVKRLKPSLVEKDLYSTTTGNFDFLKKKEYVKVQEIHDLINAKMKIMSYDSGAGEFLYDNDVLYPIIPFERLAFGYRPMKIWGSSVSQKIYQHVKSLSKYHSALDSLLGKLGITKVLYNQALWKADMIKKLEASSDSVIGIAGPPTGSYEVMDLGISSKQFVFDRAIALKEETIRSISGVTRSQMGEHDVGAKTAFEVNVLKGSADVKMAMRLELFESFASRVMEKLLYIVSIEYEPARVAQMTGIRADVVDGLMQPYDPSRFVLSYGESAMEANNERLQKLTFLLNSGLPLNPVEFGRIFMDALNLEYTDNLILPGIPMGKPTPARAQQSDQNVSKPGNRQEQGIGNREIED